LGFLRPKGNKGKRLQAGGAVTCLPPSRPKGPVPPAPGNKAKPGVGFARETKPGNFQFRKQVLVGRKQGFGGCEGPDGRWCAPFKNPWENKPTLLLIE